jgi:hypothetical protein
VHDIDKPQSVMEQNNWFRSRENGVQFYRIIMVYVIYAPFAVVTKLSHRYLRTSSTYIYTRDATWNNALSKFVNTATPLLRCLEAATRVTYKPGELTWAT